MGRFLKNGRLQTSAMRCWAGDGGLWWDSAWQFCEIHPNERGQWKHPTILNLHLANRCQPAVLPRGSARDSEIFSDLRAARRSSSC
jgi:hypothetical protein